MNMRSVKRGIGARVAEAGSSGGVSRVGGCWGTSVLLGGAELSVSMGRLSMPVLVLVLLFLVNGRFIGSSESLEGGSSVHGGPFSSTGDGTGEIVGEARGESSSIRVVIVDLVSTADLVSTVDLVSTADLVFWWLSKLAVDLVSK